MTHFIDIKSKIAVVIIIAIINIIYIAELFLGFTEAYFFWKYSNLHIKENCPIYYSLLIGGQINDIFCGIGCLCLTLCKIISEKMSITNTNNNETLWNGYISWIFDLHCLKFAYLIVVMITYNDILLCYQYIITNAREFWIFIMIHFASGCVFVGAVIIICVLVLCLMLYEAFIKKYKTNTDNNSDEMIEMIVITKNET